jgi:electron transfer flavoprotein alpha subunit
MKSIVYVQLQGGKATKASLEAAAFAAQEGEAVAVVSGAIEGDGGLGAVGVRSVLHCAEELDFGQSARLVSAAVESEGSDTVVMAHDHSGRAVAPRVAVRLNAGLIASVTGRPSGETIKRNVFSGKATAEVSASSDRRVITTTPNAFGIGSNDGAPAEVKSFSTDVGDRRVQVVEAAKPSTGDRAPLPEAELVVSAGRGMKGPENWGIIEDLADALGATTACSRPVSDIGWRPHHEHVGQTGIAIRPNLYIAVGISGAIQHLAGVNNSKVIVVINTDPEAPFFKAADYGIVGDAFEVVPKLTAAILALD